MEEERRNWETLVAERLTYGEMLNHRMRWMLTLTIAAGILLMTVGSNLPLAKQLVSIGAICFGAGGLSLLMVLVIDVQAGTHTRGL